jgi:hypothetical protein
MAKGTRNPNPRGTVWGILGLAFFMVVIVGWLAISSQGFFQLTFPEGTLSQPVVFTAVICLIASTAFIVHRSHQRRGKK